jgi:beta-glucuronidase
VEARRLDPTRPIGFANVMGSTPDRDVLTDLFDVVMLHRYYGWYVSSGDLATAERLGSGDLRLSRRVRQPIMFPECVADTFPGVHDVVPGPWSEEYQAELLAMFRCGLRTSSVRQFENTFTVA